MANWLKYRVDLADTSEVVLMAAELGIDRFSVAARLMAVWTWFGDNTTDGTVTLSSRTERGDQSARRSRTAQMTMSGERRSADGATAIMGQIDRTADFAGFADAMESVGWLVVSDDAIAAPNWERHNSETAKKRAQNASRSAGYRSRKGPAHSDSEPNPDALSSRSPSRSRHASSATREEKKREEYSSPPIAPPPKNPPASPTSETPEGGGGGSVAAPSAESRGPISTAFEFAWSVWPKHRKSMKPTAWANFRHAVSVVAEQRSCSAEDAAWWLADLIGRFSQSEKAKSDKCPALHNWLLDGRWDDDEATWKLSGGAPASKPKRPAPTEHRVYASARRELHSQGVDTSQMTGEESLMQHIARIRSETARRTQLTAACDELGAASDEREELFIGVSVRRGDLVAARKKSKTPAGAAR